MVIHTSSSAVVEEVLDPREEPTTVILLNGHGVKLLSKYVHTHRLVLFSVFIKEVPLSSEQGLM